MARRLSLLVPGVFVGENRSGRIRRRCGTGRREIVCDGLGEGVVARINAELSNKRTPGMRTAKGKSEVRPTYTRRLIHINPGTIDVKTRFRVIKTLKFARPVSGTSARLSVPYSDARQGRTQDSLAHFRMEPI
jgi:hypothetical protein